jgi:hypothetical protein
VEQATKLELVIVSMLSTVLRHVTATDVGAVKAATIQRSSLPAVTTIGLDIASSVFALMPPARCFDPERPKRKCSKGRKSRPENAKSPEVGARTMENQGDVVESIYTPIAMACHTRASKSVPSSPNQQPSRKIGFETLPLLTHPVKR